MSTGLIKTLIKTGEKKTPELMEQAGKGEFSKAEKVIPKEPFGAVEGVDQATAKSVAKKAEGAAVQEEVKIAAKDEAQTLAQDQTKSATTEEVKAVVDDKSYDELERDIVEEYEGEQLKSNLNIDNIQTTDDVMQLLGQVGKHNEEFSKARRGVVSNEQTLSEASNFTIEELLGRAPGDAFNAAQITAARQIMVESAERLRNMADKVLSGDDSSETLLAFRQMGANHVAIQQQVSGMTAEAGRALQAFRIPAEGGQLHQQQLSDMLSLSGGQESAKAMAKMIQDSKNIKELNQSMRKTYGANLTDMFFEQWINGLLSGPTTHEVNMLSNAAVIIFASPERLAAAGFSKIRGASPEDAVFAEETMAQIFGMIYGFRDSLKMAGKSFIRGEGQFDQMSKVEQRKYTSITAENLSDAMSSKGLGSIDKDSMFAKGIDLWGEFIRIPGRALQAEDDMFKIINYRMELNALAYRQARSEGHEGSALSERIIQLVDKPTEEIHMGAVDFARTQTFTNELGTHGQAMQRAINYYPPLKIMMPFMRTMTNIQKYVGHRSPLGLLSGKVRADIKAGGARGDLAKGKMAVGSMLTGYSLYLAMNGDITGAGHKWSGVRKADYRQGWQPYSIKGPDGEWVSFSRFDPIGMYLGLVADAYEIAQYGSEEDLTEAAGAVSLALYQNMTNKTYAKGLTDFHRAFTMGGNYWNNWKNNFIASTVPYTSLLSTVERGVDPTIRDAQDVISKIRSRIPGL